MRARLPLIDPKRLAALLAAEDICGICNGHIEGSTSLPYHQLLDAETGGFALEPVLRKKFERAGVDLRAPVVCSFGSGVTACVLALETLGHPAAAVYDGSWTDWARRISPGATS